MNKLFRFFKSLSHSELKKFQEFIESPYFNKREDVQLLFQYLVRNPDHFDENILFKAVFPKRDFLKKDWHLLCSRLFKLGEKFLILEELNEEEMEQKVLLTKAFRKRKQPLLFNTTLNNSEKQLNKQTYRDADFWQHQFTFAYAYYDFVASHNRKDKTNLQKVNDSLDYYFITNKLKMACLAHARQTINQETYKIHLLGETLDFLEQHPEISEVPSVQIYYWSYKAITDSGNEYWFTKLRESIKLHLYLFQRTEQRDILLFATNYCIRHLNEGKAAFIREAFELYRLSLTNGFLIEDGAIAESTFVNIVSLAARLKEYDWARSFIEEQRAFLKPVFQDPIYHFCIGRLLYETNQYDESMRHLAQVSTKASFLLLGTKILQLKIYYEQEEFEALDYVLESLRIYLQRRKNLGYRKRGYEQLIYFFRKLIELPYQSKAKRVEFIQELSDSEGFFEKEWMLIQVKTVRG